MILDLGFDVSCRLIWSLVMDLCFFFFIILLRGVWFVCWSCIVCWIVMWFWFCRVYWYAPQMGLLGFIDLRILFTLVFCLLVLMISWLVLVSLFHDRLIWWLRSSDPYACSDLMVFLFGLVLWYYTSSKSLVLPWNLGKSYKITSIREIDSVFEMIQRLWNLWSSALLNVYASPLFHFIFFEFVFRALLIQSSLLVPQKYIDLMHNSLNLCF